MKVPQNFKSAKTLAVCLTCLLVVTACGTGDDLEKDILVTDESYVAGKSLPSGAKTKKYIGNGWFYFELNEDCFIYSDKGRSSIMAKITCDN